MPRTVSTLLLCALLLGCSGHTLAQLPPPDPAPDPDWITPWTWIGVDYKTINTQRQGPYWTECETFSVVSKICWYGSTDAHNGQPYSMAGITLEYTSGTSITLGRTTGNGAPPSCLTLDIDNGEVFTSIQVNNIDDTNGDIDEVIMQTNHQGTWQYGGGSGNDLHNATLISDDNVITTGSGYLCGMAATYQDASEDNDPLITQVAFFFLQPIQWVNITGINTTTYQDQDQAGYSTYGQFQQTEICQAPGQAGVCQNQMNVMTGQSTTIVFQKAITKGHTSQSSAGYSISVQASVGQKDIMSYQFGASFSRTFSKTWTNTDTNTNTDTQTFGTITTVSLTDTCVCPLNIQSGTNCTWYFGQIWSHVWQDTAWQGQANYLLASNKTFSLPTSGTSSGGKFSGSLGLINVTCNEQAYRLGMAGPMYSNEEFRAKHKINKWKAKQPSPPPRPQNQVGVGFVGADATPDPKWIAPSFLMGINYNTTNTEIFGPWWTKCMDFVFVSKICFYGSTDFDKNLMPYSFAGVNISYTDGTYYQAGRFNGASNSCMNIDVFNGEVITSVQINTLKSTNGDIDEVIITTNGPQTFQYGGGSGNGVKESYTMSDQSVYSTASGLLCGIGGTYQDASESGDPLITQIAFYFLQEVETMYIGNINTSHIMPMDDEGYSEFGSIQQRVLCNPSLPNACTNTVSVQNGWSSSVSVAKQHTHSSTSQVSYTQTDTVGATIGDPKSNGVQISGTLSLGWGTLDSKSTSTTDTTNTASNQQTTQTMTDFCNCPSNITTSTYCTFNFGYKAAIQWQDSEWTALAWYTLKTGVNFSIPTGGTTSGSLYYGDLSLINIICDGSPTMYTPTKPVIFTV